MALYLFDLIGTLTDSSRRYAYALAQTCRRHGLPEPSMKDVVESLGNKNLKQILDDYVPGLHEGDLTGFMSECNSTCDGLLSIVEWQEDLYPGAAETLINLRKNGHGVGIYTGTREAATRALMEYHGLDAIVGPYWIRAKNAQRDEGLNTIELKRAQIQSMCAQADQTAPVVVVGDTISDFEAAQLCSTGFVGFAPVTDKARIFESAGVAEIFSSYKNFPGLGGSHPAQRRQPTLSR